MAISDPFGKLRAGWRKAKRKEFNAEIAEKSEEVEEGWR